MTSSGLVLSGCERFRLVKKAAYRKLIENTGYYDSLAR